MSMTIQVAPDDCTGCGVCVDVCPAKSKSEVRHKAINMEPAAAHREAERRSWDFFLAIPELDRDVLPHDSVKGSQALQPLFEFSGACAGCGETPYIKLVTQLFGDRMIVANATGCSSIYGGNLPTTPWTTNAEGRGPAWTNSLFEDNAEFGLGIRLGYEAQQRAGAAARRAAGRRSSAPTWRSRSSPPTSPTSRASEPSASASPRCATTLGTVADTTSTTPRRSTCASVADALVTQGRLDHRWRRLGLRHRLRRPRPRAVERPQRQHPRARHRGVLEHRRPGVEGDAPRCGRQVRRRRQDQRQEGPRRHRPRLRQRLRGADRHRRQRHCRPPRRCSRPTAWPGPEPRHRLLDLHRPRDRHVDSR